MTEEEKLQKKCSLCLGSGECYQCNGEGDFRCMWCNGTGKINDETCTSCNGTGRQGCTLCHGTGTCHNCNGTGDEPGEAMVLEMNLGGKKGLEYVADKTIRHQLWRNINDHPVRGIYYWWNKYYDPWQRRWIFEDGEVTCNFKGHESKWVHFPQCQLHKLIDVIKL
ncbi:MAG: hypothetical protein ACE5OZ_01185 [Candidatus Heimdallarchaeota archaeon]